MLSYIHEPTDLQCGQAVIAMVCNVSVDEVIALLNNDRETNLKEMKQAFSHYGFKLSDIRKEATSKNDLPKTALLSLETPRCWHWSLYHEGVFYDPEHGVMEDFPVCNRKYYWEIVKGG